MQVKKQFQKFISKSALAEEYGVNTRTLMRWINKSEECIRELYNNDYDDNQKGFYPGQTKIIFKYLGEPGE